MVERQIYLARRTVIEMISDRGYDISQIVKNYPFSRFKSMLEYFDNYSGVIDIIADKRDDDKRIYVKFISKINEKKSQYEGITQSSVRSVNKELTELKEFIDNTYMPNEIIFVICYGDNLHEKHIEEEEKYHNLQIFHISNITFNISKHVLVPKHEKLNKIEVQYLFNKIMIDSVYQLPYINPTDPMAKYINLREGDVCRIIRNSVDAVVHICYRVCSDYNNNKKPIDMFSNKNYIKRGVIDVYDEIDADVLDEMKLSNIVSGTKEKEEDLSSVEDCNQGIVFTSHNKYPNVSTDIPYALHDDELFFSIISRLTEFSLSQSLDDSNTRYKGSRISTFLTQNIKDYGNWTKNSKQNTLNYMFNKFRSGYYVQIRDGKLNMFIPFYNIEFKNNWYHLVTPTQTIRGINKKKEQWTATNCLLKITYKPLEETYKLDTFREVENMFGQLCENRGDRIPDIDLFVNVKDFPMLRKNKTEPYNHIYGKGVSLKDEWKDLSYYPILSFNSNDDFLDIPIPTNHEWQAITQQIFPSRCQKQYINDFSPIPWNEKESTAVFRGSATGCSLNIDKNPRLKVAQLDKEWRQVGHLNNGLLNAGVTKFPNHLITEEGDSNIYNSRDPRVPMVSQVNYDDKPLKDIISCGNWEVNKKGLKGDDYINYINMQDQSSYKYILNIEGNSAAYRLSYLLSLGSVILNVKCENKLWWEKLWKPYNIGRDDAEGSYDPTQMGEYIEIEHDLSNLEEAIRWCRNHDETCKQIAKNSKAFYHKYLTQKGVFDYLEMIINNIANNEDKKVYKTNIIVPFRDIPEEQKTSDTQDRSKHLKQFKEHMITFIPKLIAHLREKGIESEFDITIIEQSQDGNMFNRGALLNTAYHLTCDGDDTKYDSYIFHDVDLLPNDNLISAYAGPYQRGDIAHIASEWGRYKNLGKYLGGVTLFGSYVLSLINGFPNNYWGWGGEDDELRRRRGQLNGILPVEPVDPLKLVGKPNGLVDLEEITQYKDKKVILESQGNMNPVRYEGKELHEKTWESNGLNQFKIDDVSKPVFDIENSNTESIQIGEDLFININTITVVLDYDQMKPFEEDSSLSK
jgi:DNA-directed RNA polymerase subunit H (RpoH/RPB5)